jgi:hypothetical protein
MALNRKLRQFFFTITNVVRSDGTTGGVRFLKTNKPTQEVMNNLVDSCAFLTESDDRAKLYTGAIDLSLEQGLCVLSTDVQAKANTTQLLDRSLVTQPHQLPTVENDAAQTIPLTNDVPAFNDVIVETTIDGGITTRNKFMPRLKSTFINWITTNILPRLTISGGTTGQILIKNSNTNYDVTWTSASAIDQNVKVSAADTTTNYLNNKIAVSSDLSKTILNPGGNEQLQISNPNLGNVKITNADTTANKLNNKLTVSGLALSKTITNPGANEGLDITTTNEIYKTKSSPFANADYLSNLIVLGKGIDITQVGDTLVVDIKNSGGFTSLPVLNGWTGSVYYFISGRTAFVVGDNLDNNAATSITIAQLPSNAKPSYADHIDVMIHSDVTNPLPMACYPIKINTSNGDIQIRYNFATMPSDNNMFFSVSYPLSL